MVLTWWVDTTYLVSFCFWKIDSLSIQTKRVWKWLKSKVLFSFQLAFWPFWENFSYFSCSNLFLGGTKNQYWERTYTGLPAHNQLNLTYTVYVIDSWDGASVDDHYEIQVDDYLQRGWSFSGFTNYGVATCGSGNWGEYPPVIAISTFVHSGSSVRIRFINMLNQASNDESLGIRDIKLKFVNVTTPSNSLCGRSTANKPLPNWPCSECDTPHQYMALASSGTCYECADSCATCNAAGANGCTSCYSGNYISGGTCSPCSSNCATCTGSASHCTTCPSAMFMASNACYLNCMFPLSVSESGGIAYCNSPCSGSDYAMWDGSCSSTCLPELSATTMSSYRVCTFPCSVNPIRLWFNLNRSYFLFLIYSPKFISKYLILFGPDFLKIILSIF